MIVPEKPHWGGNNKVCMYIGVEGVAVSRGSTADIMPKQFYNNLIENQSKM